MNKFIQSVVNPATLSKLIIEMNAVKIKDVEIPRDQKNESFETEDDKMFTFKNNKKSNASAGDILNLRS